MIRCKGEGAFGAVVMGSAYVLKTGEPKILKRTAESREEEGTKLAAAAGEAGAYLREAALRARKEQRPDTAGIFEAQQTILMDEEYTGYAGKMIERDGLSAEYAVSLTGAHYEELLSALGDDLVGARSADVRDVTRRLIRILTGEAEEPLPETEGRVILCAEDLTPTETAGLDRNRIAAFVTARGSSISHTAILAREMSIPAVVGLGTEAFGRIQNGMELIVDGRAGEVFLQPDDETRSAYREKAAADADERARLATLIGKENRTMDGRTVEITANIGDADGLRAVLENDADGIGLFRSEFIFLNRAEEPTEEEQYAIYKKVLEEMAGRKVIIRTLDVGADKSVDYLGLKKKENPALGLRGIRVLLKHPKLLKTQLRALYRASVYGNLKIMFPMVTNVEEFRQALEICKDVREELQREGWAYDENVGIGVMIETPAAAILSESLAEIADFFSVGTNDLTQYTLACDRLNPDLAFCIDPRSEAVLKLIEVSASSAHKYGKPIGICGELAADTDLTETFLKMGIDSLSVVPSSVLKLRERVRSLNLEG